MPRPAPALQPPTIGRADPTPEWIEASKVFTRWLEARTLGDWGRCAALRRDLLRTGHAISNGQPHKLIKLRSASSFSGTPGAGTNEAARDTSRKAPGPLFELRGVKSATTPTTHRGETLGPDEHQATHDTV